jgi:hypothetical protein
VVTKVGDVPGHDSLGAKLFPIGRGEPPGELPNVLGKGPAAVRGQVVGLAERYAVSALELLARAQAAGFFNEAANVAQLGTDTDLSALRDRNDFRKFVEEVLKPSPSKQE